MKVLPMLSTHCCRQIFLPLLLLCTGCTPSLHDVIGRGDMGRAQAMLEAHPELVHDENELGKQPLHYAVYYKQGEALDMLLAHGADVNAADNTGMTALHGAAMMGRKEMLWLLGNGADWKQRDAFGDLPSHTAALYDQARVLVALFEAGDSLQEKNNAGFTPLDLARKHRRENAAHRIESLLGLPEQPVERP